MLRKKLHAIRLYAKNYLNSNRWGVHLRYFVSINPQLENAGREQTRKISNVKPNILGVILTSETNYVSSSRHFPFKYCTL